MNELALFAGAGGGILGGKLLGWRTICAVEWMPYPSSVLCARQNDKLLESFPIWDDVQTFDGRPWRGIVDVISGGFPCQDISSAGKGAGIDGERSSMWNHMARIIDEVRPRFVFVENSPLLVSRGLNKVLGDLTQIGYDARWTIMAASDVGAPHQRKRFWMVAHTRHGSGWDFGAPQARHHPPPQWATYPNKVGRSSKQSAPVGDPYSLFLDFGEDVADSTSIGQQRQREYEQPLYTAQGGQGEANYVESIGTSDQWAVEPQLGRVADGVACRMERLKALGNGQVPLCAAEAWRYLMTPPA